MKIILDENYYMFLGQYAAISRIRGSAQNIYFKIMEGQRHYFFKKTGLIFSEYQNEVVDTLDNALHKFMYGSITLEQLWGVTHYLEAGTYGLPKTIDLKITVQHNEMTFLLSYLLDQTLYSWRSFLDFYFKYLILFITGRNVVNSTTRKFKDQFLEYIKNYPNDKKAEEIFTYINNKVLNKTLNSENGTECWGDLLRSLRDKTTHNKLIKPTFEEKENSQGLKIIWPTIKGVNFAFLAQLNFENKAFDMIRELFPILYEIEWKSGPYKPGMFNN